MCRKMLSFYVFFVVLLKYVLTFQWFYGNGCPICLNVYPLSLFSFFRVHNALCLSRDLPGPGAIKTSEQHLVWSHSLSSRSQGQIKHSPTIPSVRPMICAGLLAVWQNLTKMIRPSLHFKKHCIKLLTLKTSKRLTVCPVRNVYRPKCWVACVGEHANFFAHIYVCTNCI